ncbi:MAG: GNAT family N-acetyltransferase [Bacteroidetes bacterium]|nr:GNAT family N-acetyltransferase [Bacteroidota bacterium]
MLSTWVGTIEDLQALQQLAITTYTDTFGEYYTPGELKEYLDDTYGSAKLQGEFAEPFSKPLLAFDDNKLAGFLRLRKNQIVEKHVGADNLEIHQLYVHRNYHGAGVSMLLMEEAVKYAVEQGYSMIWLSVWEHNTRAQRFYSKCDFEVFDKYNYMAGNEPQVDLLMKRKL